jgi:hypothetical protein
MLTVRSLTQRAGCAYARTMLYGKLAIDAEQIDMPRRKQCQDSERWPMTAPE